MDKRYQVFVSSTYADLKDERHKVIQALMEMDCIPAGMELFPAADEEQFEFIKSIINDCDYYILIIGGRYGSTDEKGMSYTEKEYEYAKSRGLKVLSFVHESPSKIAFEKSEADPVLRQRLDDFRQKIQANTLVKLWSIPTELPGAVALSLSKTIKAHPAIGWVRANLLPSQEILSDLNELRKENARLLRQNTELEMQMSSSEPKLHDLAGLSETYTITGDRQYPNYSGKRRWSFSITWASLFAAVAPYILAQPNDSVMESHFRTAIQELYEAKCSDHDDFTRWNLDVMHYQTVKVQFMALNLVDISMKNTSGGSMSLFWCLTASGEAALLDLRTVKTRVAEL